MNKIDVFKQKMGKKDLSTTFPEYSGGNDVEKGIEFLQERYRQHNKFKPERLHFYITQATDKENVRQIFEQVKDLIVGIYGKKIKTN